MERSFHIFWQPFTTMRTSVGFLLAEPEVANLRTSCTFCGMLFLFLLGICDAVGIVVGWHILFLTPSPFPFRAVLLRSSYPEVSDPEKCKRPHS